MIQQTLKSMGKSTLALLVLFPLSFALADVEEIPAGHLHKVYTNEKPRVGLDSLKVSAPQGDMIQLSVPCKTKGMDVLRGLKVEIEGDAVEKIGVAFVPIELPGDPHDDPPTHNEDRIHKDLSCFLKAVK